MTKIFLIRHGETAGNKDRIFRGKWDVPLNEAGERQVEMAGAALEDIAIDAIYTSPLKRAVQTALAVASGRSIKPLADDDFSDIDYGEWSEKPLSEVKELYPEIYDSWKTRPGEVVFPGGEGLKDVRDRVRSGMIRLAQKHSGGNIVIVSHRVVIKIALCIALDLSDSAFWKIQADTASISAISWKDGFLGLIFSNETCHLKTMKDKLDVVDF